jgi:hypothetical protein
MCRARCNAVLVGGLWLAVSGWYLTNAFLMMAIRDMVSKLKQTLTVIGDGPSHEISVLALGRSKLDQMTRDRRTPQKLKFISMRGDLGFEEVSCTMTRMEDGD